MNKKGISLIVLVITIIVMIIIAAGIVITLSNTNVINRASQAVDLTNESSVQDFAALAWADAYMDNKRGQDLIDTVTATLTTNNITAANWSIEISDTSISVARLIAFCIADSEGNTTYKATSKMTWEEWVVSEYNPKVNGEPLFGVDGEFIGGYWDDEHQEYMEFVAGDPDFNNMIKPSDVIISGGQYYFG